MTGSVQPPADRPEPRIVYLPRRSGSGCRHDAGPDCETHGCPDCRLTVETDGGLAVCHTCEHLRAQSYAAWLELNPAIVCELEDCLHCERCETCSKAGNVCRNCDLCTACAAEDEWGPCALQRWSPQAGREVLSRFVHELLHPGTGLWTRHDSRRGWLPR